MNTIDVNSYTDSKVIEKINNDVKKYSNPLDLQKNFLNLLIAQIKNQDPTDPIKNTELTSQLAQINTVMGVNKLNNTVMGVSDKIQKNQNIQASLLIGHRIIIPISQMMHTKNVETKFGIKLNSHANSVKIQIKDENDKIIYLKNMKNVQPGVQFFSWNGENIDKKSVSSGKYNVSVEAKNEGKSIPVTILNEALVESIITTSGDPVIDLGIAGRTTFSKIYAILK